MSRQPEIRVVSTEVHPLKEDSRLLRIIIEFEGHHYTILKMVPVKKQR